jgi:hypothetical protein
MVEAARQSLGGLAAAAPKWRERLAAPRLRTATGAVLVLAAGSLLLRAWRRRRGRTPAATRAYLALRRTLARSQGAVPASTAPAEVARRVAKAFPGSADDARRVVALYCASAFGGRTLDREAERDLARRVRRVRRLA